MPKTPLYDDLSQDYDRFVNWESRLAYEMPFIERQLAAAGAKRVLDAACGTGMHALALAQRGYEVTGADLSEGMIARARGNAAQMGVQSRFAVAGLGELATQLGGGFDAALCLGSSLPHLLTPADLALALADFAAVLRPGGLLLIQNRNFAPVVERRERWMPPESHRDGAGEWLFIRFYDWEAEGRVAFNVMTLQRQGDGPWRQSVSATRLWPQLQLDLLPALAEVGFGEAACWGDLQGAPYVAESSGNLIITARRS